MNQPKISDEQIAVIRHLLSLGRTQAELASVYGCSQTTVSHIKSGRRGNPTKHERQIREPATLSPAQVARVKDAYADGVGIRVLAGRFHAPVEMIRKLVKGAA